MNLPAWADAVISEKISRWRKTGEGQNLEFKADFPDDNQKLRKEVAAFATSGGGHVLIGVQNNGDVKGLTANSEDERDDLLLRAQQTASQVKPCPDYQIHAAADDNGKFIIVIEVSDKQEHPVFYSDYRPIVRDRRVSRPAEPGEVQELVWKHPSSDFQKERERLMLESEKLMVEQGRSIVHGRRT